MKKKYVNKLVSILTMIAVLFSVMVFQLVNAYDDVGDFYNGGDFPYTLPNAEGYYEKTIKVYNDDTLRYTDTYYNTFDTNGRIIEQKVVEDRAEGDLIKDHTYYYTYKYDQSGRIIEQNMDGDVAKYEYRNDGSHVMSFYSAYLDMTEYYTFDPILKVYDYGNWRYEFDNKGRKIKMVFDSEDEGTIEKLFSYIEDSSGRVTKKIYTTKQNGQVIESGEVIITYTNSGRTETRKAEDEYYGASTLIFNYNGNNQLMKINFSSADYSVVFDYTYDAPGNVTLIIGNHTYKDSDTGKTKSYKTRYEATYETHNRGASSLNGLVQGPDGKWAMYKNGEVDTSVTGIYQNAYGWWRVEKGFVNFNANGIYQNQHGWWKTTNGKVTFKETGVFQNEFGWWRVKDSKVDFSANGIYQNQHGWWKTTNGKVTFKENGVFQNENGWWYVKNSQVDFKYFGIASNQNGSWFIRNGKVDFSKSGVVEISGHVYTLKDGKVVKP